MSNPVFLQPATYTPRRLLREAQILCRIGAATDAAEFLGSDAGGAERDESLAGFLNVCLEEFLRDFSHLGLTSSGSSTTAFDPFCDLPTNLHGNDIQEIYWSGSGSGYRENIRVRPVASNDMRHLPPGIINNTARAEWPEFYAVVYDPAGAKWRIRFLPMPTMKKNFTIIHRVQPTSYTKDNLDSTGATVIIPVPDASIEPLIYLVAERIQIRNTGSKSPTPESLREQYEFLRKKQAYIETPTDELVSGAFIPAGTQPTTGWEDRESWNAMTDYEGLI